MDKQTIRKLQEILNDLNKKWCPDKLIRLSMIIDPHFAERLEERFNHETIGPFMKEVWRWLNGNYCHLLYEAHSKGQEDIVRREVKLDHGTLVVTVYRMTVRLRTCYE